MKTLWVSRNNRVHGTVTKTPSVCYFYLFKSYTLWWTGGKPAVSKQNLSRIFKITCFRAKTLIIWIINGNFSCIGFRPMNLVHECQICALFELSFQMKRNSISTNTSGWLYLNIKAQFSQWDNVYDLHVS